MRVHIPAEIKAKRNQGDAAAALVEEEIARREWEIKREAITKTAKLTLLTVANLLVEKRGWGTREGSTRLPELLRDVEQVIVQAGDRYGFDCVLTAQEARARANGFELSI